MADCPTTWPTVGYNGGTSFQERGLAVATTIGPRDDQILRTLTMKVPMLSLPQVASTWWNKTPSGVANARRRLGKLTRLGLVTRLRLVVRPLPNMTGPTVA
jgi:hypothetical protein